MEYQNLVNIYQRLEATTKRLEKTYVISEFLKRVEAEDLPKVILLLQGKVFPNWDPSKIGVASRLILKAIAISTGIDTKKIEESWKRSGDLGKTAEELVVLKKQATLFSKELNVKKVFDNLRKLATLEGAGTVERKIQLIAELLTSAKPLEARYVVRTVLGELRVGVGEGSLRDAIVWAFFTDEIGFKYNQEENNIEIENRDDYNKYVNAVQQAFDLTNDFSSVAKVAKTKGLNGLLDMQLEVNRPVKVMLAIKVKDVDEGFGRVGKPAAIEYKYDGFRMQIHKAKDKITIFTRRLEDVTKQFPEVVKYVKDNVKGKNFIIDSEAVGYDPKTGKYLPFQSISQRIKRKYSIEKMAKDFPVELNVFDIIYYEGKNLIKDSFGQRHELLWKIINQVPRKIVLAKNLITSNEDEVKDFYNESLKAGNEGIMFKKLDAPYKPGARVGHMVKLKGEQEGIDVVITAADWGEGKRATWLSSFTIACIDEDGIFLEVGKVGTGIKEKAEEGVSFEELTNLLKPSIIAEKGKTVKLKPEIVVEVKYEEIQKSPTYSSGFALRFPRFKRLRHMERSPEDIETLNGIRSLYNSQKKTS
ncbi:ATP-dependent DNA ligase [Candidatus Woesearchaeota archaeon]|nr:ATP-dependent DNA ligase [Candidatus Woesearchaeota archaeon]